MKYKLLVTDYDGTLGQLNDISDKNLSAVKKFQDMGGKFVICTGRSFNSILPILQKYDIKGDIITFQGAVIVNIESRKLIYDGEVDKNLIIDINEKLKSANVATGVYLNDHIVYESVNDKMNYYLQHVGFGAQQVKSLKTALLETPLKVRKLIALGDGVDIEKLRDKYAKEYKGKLIVNTSSAELLEVISPNNSKGEGVKRIAEYYNIPLKEVITVGDSNNDVELVKGEWHGVAVGDSVEELKKSAKEVTVDFKCDAISYLLEKYCF